MRIVIILCPCPTLRKVLGPETLAARRGPSACSFDCDTNRCHLGIPGTQKPCHPGIPCTPKPCHPATPGTPKPPGAPLPISISHVIPPRLFQTLNPHRWNSAVFSRLSICLTIELRAKLMASFSGQPQRFDTLAGPHSRIHDSRTRTNQHRYSWNFVVCRRAQPTRQTNCDGLRTFVQVVCM